MASRLAAMATRLPALPTADPTYQERVDLAMDDYAGQTSPQLVAAYIDLRREKDALEEAERAVNLKLEALTQLIVLSFESHGVSSLTLDSGETVRVQPEPYAQIEDRDLFRAWCMANGLERSLALPWTTANAITKERLLNGDTEPPGVRAYLRNKIVLRRS